MHVTLRYNAISGLCNGIAFAMRERKETPFFYAQIKRVTTVRRQNWPTGRNQLGATQLDAADWLIRRPRPRCTLTVLCVRYIIHVLGRTDAFSKIFQVFAQQAQTAGTLCVYRQAFDNR